MKSYEFRRGSKKIYGVLRPDGRVRLMTDCNQFPDALIELFVSEAQADAIGARSTPIQEILPQVAPEMREIFASGATPAEHDVMKGEELRSQEAYQLLGYKFD